MKYILNKDVYLVKGKINSCIYDFNKGNLYSINENLYQELSLLNEGKLKENNKELQYILKQLYKKEIITISEKIRPHYIEEIQKEIQCNMAWIEITTKCNLKCKHCYNESDVQCQKTMTLEDFKKAINAVKLLGINKIQIIGGEPFVYPKLLKEMLEYAVKKVKFIEIFTNGTLITKEWADYLANNGIYVALSVYSYEEKMHDKVTTVKGSLKKTNESIKLLKEKCVNYRISTVLMKKIDIGTRTTDLYEINLKKDVVRMTGRANVSLLSEDLIAKKLITKETFRKKITKSFSSRLISGHNCFNNKIYIATNLEVFPCVMERRMSHGKINDKGEISLDNKIRKLNKDKIEECKQCEYRYACFDYRPNSISGELIEKPWYCTYKPELGIWEDKTLFIRRLREKWEF